MDKYVEHIRIVDKARVAVLCIHGILSTPNHFRDLIPIIPKEYSVYAMITDGHCLGVSEFSKSSLKKWEKGVDKVVEQLLQTHEEVYIVGHSLGTLLAIGQGMKNPKVTKLFCVSIPIKVRFRIRMIGMAARIYFKCVKDNDIYTLACMESYGVTDSKNIFKYLGWAPRFIDLFKIINETRKNLDKLETKCVAYQSMLDELVSPKSIDILKKESKIRVEVLAKSTHFYYPEDDYAKMKKDFMSFLFDQ